VEAVLGAVYLDGGLGAATEVWHRIRGAEDVERLQEVLRGDYKSQLQQLTQARLRVTPSYRLSHTSGPEHSKEFHIEVLTGERVLGSGTGRNKQIAEQEAAQRALALLLGELGQEALVQDGEGETGAQEQQEKAGEEETEERGTP
jgi:ribonuclease-3